MDYPQLPRPTDAELEILTVLWQDGERTVRELHEVINRRKPTVYTTVLKMLQIMTEKGLVQRDERNRAHIYRARLSQDETQQQLVNDLLHRAFNGSAAQLVMQVLASKCASTGEMAQIRQMIKDDEVENRHRDFDVIL
ncbi:MAG: hypothetical protein NVSMB56_15170 [Pyrinomonadaceae bacterium]